MRYEFNLATAFIKSRKGKWPLNSHTLLSILGITVGVAFLVFALCIYDGYVKKVETIIFSFYPPITLQAPLEQGEDDTDDDGDLVMFEEESETCARICGGTRILEDKTVSTSVQTRKRTFDLKEFPALQKKLEAIPGVLHAGPVLLDENIFTFSYSSNGRTVTETHPLRFFGVQAGGKTFVPEVNRTITDAGLLKKLAADTPGVHHVILSAELYQRLYGTIPDNESTMTQKIHLNTGPPQSPNVLDLTVVGIFRLGMHNISKNMIITSLTTAQEIFSLQGRASLVGLALDDPYNADTIVHQVREATAKEQYPVFHWLTLAAEMFNSLSFYRRIIVVLLSMSILITSFNIYNTLNIMILERKRQIGTLTSMGMKKKGLYRVFFIISQIEALTGTAVGIVVGAIMGYFFSDYLNHALAEFLPVRGAEINIDAASLLIITLIVCLMSWATAFIATRRGLNIDTADALRSE